MQKSRFIRISYRIAAAVICVVSSMIIVGCGSDGPQRTVISGNVTYRGEPIPEGSITFAAKDSSTRTSMAAAIEDGEYRLDALGGLPVGAYRVVIVASRPLSDSEMQSKLAAGMTGPALAPQQYIPKKYNTESKLEVTVEPGSGSLTHNFELTD